MASRGKKTGLAAKRVQPAPVKPKATKADTVAAAEPELVPLREALRLHLAGDLEAAIPFYRQALDLKRTPAILNNLGAALRDLKRSAEAAPLFREAVEIKPEFTDGHLNLGLSLYDLRSFAAARAPL